MTKKKIDNKIAQFLNKIDKLALLKEAILKELKDHPDYSCGDHGELSQDNAYLVLERIDENGIKHSLDLEVGLKNEEP